MFAIASLITPPVDDMVRSIWERFEQHCGLTGVKMTPLPHFSWQTAETYLFERVESCLADLAKEMEPFTVRSSGLGIFTGTHPVVYIALVKDRVLLDVHQLLWERIHPFATGANMYYDPSQWVPHITLAFKEVQPDGLGCAVADIAFQNIDLEIKVDHFALIYQSLENAGLRSRFIFKENM